MCIRDRLKPLLDGQRSLILKSKDSQFAVSGLSLALPQKNPGQKKGIPDTYKLTLKETAPEAEVQAQVKTIASGNGAEIEQWFSVSGQKNYDKTLTLRTPLCVTMSLPEGWDSSKTVSYTHLDVYKRQSLPSAEWGISLKLDFHGIKFNIWLYFMLFAAGLLALVGGAQLLLIKPYYRSNKISAIKEVAATIQEYVIDNQWLDEATIKKASQFAINNNVCAVVYNDSGNVVYNSCLLYTSRSADPCQCLPYPEDCGRPR